MLNEHAPEPLRGAELRAALRAIVDRAARLPAPDEYTADNRRASGHVGALVNKASGAMRKYYETGARMGRASRANPDYVEGRSREYREKLERAIAMWGAPGFSTVKAIAAHLGVEPIRLGRNMRKAGIVTSLSTAKRSAATYAGIMASRPPGCLCAAEVAQIIGKSRWTARKRIEAADLVPALQLGNVTWYREADLRAAGVLP